MGDLTLNDHHQELLNRYMQFARYQRAQNVKAMQFAFQDVMDSRLLEATYTAEEVRDMLTTLSEVVRGDMETELISFTHTNVLLLQQLCSQAEKWHLRLLADLDELQNQELLQKVKAWEEGGALPFTSRRPEKLEPLSSDGPQGPVQLLRQQMDSLRQEAASHQSIINELQSQMHRMEVERNQLHHNLTETKLKLEKALQPQDLKPSETDNAHLEEVEQQLSSLSNTLQESVQDRESVQNKLEQTNDHLRQVQAQLFLAEQELERKFSETAAYANMKKMLAKKNEQMKELRQRLRTHEPDETAAGED